MLVLEAKGLKKRYRAGDEEVDALSGVDLAVAEGEFVAIQGPSGSGKSTLISLLAGLERPTAGEVWLGGRALSGLGDAELAHLRRREVGFVFQTFNLVPVLSLAENVGLPFLLDGVARSAWEPKVKAALERVQLAHRMNHLPDRVSVGERQRAAVARALVTEPRLVFADEPTGSLDSHRGEVVLQLLREARDAARRTIVMVTHDDRAAAVADRVVRIRDGRVDGAPLSQAAGS